MGCLKTLDFRLRQAKAESLDLVLLRANPRHALVFQLLSIQ